MYQFLFPPTIQEGSLFSTPSPAFIVCRLFNDGHSDWSKIISHCSFYLHFSNSKWCWASFHVLVSCLYVFFGKVVCLGLFPTFCLGWLFFWYWVAWATCVFLEINPLSMVSLAVIFSILRALFTLFGQKLLMNFTEDDEQTESKNLPDNTISCLSD